MADDARAKLNKLSDRELEVLELMVEGKSNREIEAQLVISEGTVKTTVNHIKHKLDLIGKSKRDQDKELFEVFRPELRKRPGEVQPPPPEPVVPPPAPDQPNKQTIEEQPPVMAPDPQAALPTPNQPPESGPNMGAATDALTAPLDPDYIPSNPVPPVVQNSEEQPSAPLPGSEDTVTIPTDSPQPPQAPSPPPSTATVSTQPPAVRKPFKPSAWWLFGLIPIALIVGYVWWQLIGRARNVLVPNTFADDFSSGVSQEWTVEYGDWNTVDQALVNRDAEGLIWLVGREWTDVSVQFDVLGEAPCGHPIQALVRMQDSANYIAVRLHGCADEGVYLYQDGEPEKIGSFGKAFGRIEIRVEGDAITVYSNRDRLIEVTDTKFDTGSVGFSVSTFGQIDNVTISPVEP